MAFPSKDNIICRLNLNAVLFALEDFIKVVPEAKQILGKEKFSITFTTRSKLKSTIKFKDGRCEFIGTFNEPDAIKFYFLSDRHLNRTFTQNGFNLPLLTNGFFRFKQLIIFKRLSALLNTYLLPNTKTLEEKTFRSQHLKILLGLMFAAMKELGEYDSYSHRLLKSMPESLAYFAINDDDISGWIQWKNNKVNYGKGESPFPPDVRIIFEDSDIALAAFHNKIINMAEIGLGQLRIEGNLIIAEKLGLISERISFYLKNEIS